MLSELSFIKSRPRSSFRPLTLAIDPVRGDAVPPETRRKPFPGGALAAEPAPRSALGISAANGLWRDCISSDLTPGETMNEAKIQYPEKFNMYSDLSLVFEKINSVASVWKCRGV